MSLRPISREDDPLLYRIYASTRAEELQLVPWDDEQKRAFLEQQFTAQHRYYRQQFPDASYQVVLAGNVPIGRLYVDRREDEIRILDITLLPEFRGQGRGRSLLEDLISEAASLGVPVRIHVERTNRARTLYQRLGFRGVGDTGVYLLLEWQPAMTAQSDF